MPAENQWVGEVNAYYSYAIYVAAIAVSFGIGLDK